MNMLLRRIKLAESQLYHINDKVIEATSLNELFDKMDISKEMKNKLSIRYLKTFGNNKSYWEMFLSDYDKVRTNNARFQKWWNNGYNLQTYIVNHQVYRALDIEDLILNVLGKTYNQYQTFKNMRAQHKEKEYEQWLLDDLDNNYAPFDKDEVVTLEDIAKETYVINGEFVQAKDLHDLIINILHKTENNYITFKNFLAHKEKQPVLLQALVNNEYPFNKDEIIECRDEVYFIKGQEYHAQGLKDLIIKKLNKTANNYKTFKYLLDNGIKTEEELLTLLVDNKYPFNEDRFIKKLKTVYYIDGREFAAVDEKDLFTNVLHLSIRQYHTYQHLLENGEDKDTLLTLALHGEYPFDKNQFVKITRLLKTFNVNGTEYEARDLEDLIINKLHKTRRNYQTFNIFLGKGYTEEELFKLLENQEEPFDGDKRVTVDVRHFIVDGKPYEARTLKDLILNQLQGNEAHLRTFEYLNKRGETCESLLTSISRHEYPFEIERTNSVIRRSPLYTFHINGEEKVAESAQDLLVNLLHYPNEEYKQYAIYRKQKRFAYYSDDEFLTAFVNREYPFDIFK